LTNVLLEGQIFPRRAHLQIEMAVIDAANLHGHLRALDVLRCFAVPGHALHIFFRNTPLEFITRHGHRADFVADKSRGDIGLQRRRLS
jgi:hypothetical protein